MCVLTSCSRQRLSWIHFVFVLACCAKIIELTISCFYFLRGESGSSGTELRCCPTAFSSSDGIAGLLVTLLVY